MNRIQLRAIKNFSAFTIRYHWEDIIRGQYEKPSIDSLKPKIRPHILPTLPTSEHSEAVEQLVNDAAKLAKSEIVKALGKIHRRLESLRTEMTASVNERQIDGWNIQKSGGYYRAFRQIGGKLYGIHIGKEINLTAARTKIRRKEKQIRQQSGR